jgi:hypothetical protein
MAVLQDLRLAFRAADGNQDAATGRSPVSVMSRAPALHFHNLLVILASMGLYSC